MSDYGYGLSTIEGRVVTLPSWKEKYCTHHMLHHLENENPALKWTKNHRNLHVSLWLEVYRVILVCTCWWHKMKWIQFIRWTERDHTNKHFENVSSSARRKMYSRLLLSGILNIRGKRMVITQWMADIKSQQSGRMSVLGVCGRESIIRWISNWQVQRCEMTTVFHSESSSWVTVVATVSADPHLHGGFKAKLEKKQPLAVEVHSSLLGKDCFPARRREEVN